jgi:hypothetical protein
MLNESWSIGFLLYICQNSNNLITMKKVFAVVAVVALLASCKKDYTCSCTIAGVTSKTEIKDAKKADAEDACSALNTSASLVGGSCSLD